MNRRRFFAAFTMGAAGLLVPKPTYFFLRGNPLAQIGDWIADQPHLRYVDVREFADIEAIERDLEYYWSNYRITPDFIVPRDEETRRAFERAIAPRRRQR